MKAEDLKQCVLPKKRTGAVVRWISDTSIRKILGWGLLAYVLPVMIVSTIEWLASSSAYNAWVKSGTAGETGFWNLVYFNFITMMTVGYGDYSPHGSGARFLSITEALMGTGIMTVTLSALIAKFLSPPKDAIVFSRYAYYCTEPQRFMVIYMNTTQQRIVNADLSSYFKLGSDWGVMPSVRSPLITRAVQTFYVVEESEESIIELLDVDHPEDACDRLRFGISGQIGGSSFSAAIEYDTKNIFVIFNRDTLTKYEGFWQPDLTSRDFQEMFHYKPKAPTLVEYVKERRKQQNWQVQS